MRALLGSLLLCLLLAGCGGGHFDTDQRRLCRQAIPPLNPPGARIKIERTVDGPQRNILRIFYRNESLGQRGGQRVIDCLFAGDGTTIRVGTLIGIAVDGRPMSEARFYMLRRFYLEDREQPPPDPGAPQPPDLVELPASLAYGLQTVLSGLPSAAIYALLASAYALIFGLTGRIVLSFGEFAALGASAAMVGVALVLPLTTTTPLGGLFIGIAFAVVATALHGFAMSRAVLRPLARASGQQVLIATIGLAIAMSESLRLLQGAQLRWLPPVANEPRPLARSGEFILTVTPIALSLSAAGLGGALAIMLLIRRSAYGRAWRAVADDARTAALFGVDAQAVRDLALIIGCAASGLAGLIVTMVYGGIGFAGGFSLGLKALVAAILGGIGSVPGAALGGLALAAFDIAWSAALPIDQRDIAVYALLVVILTLRPGGFFGERERTPRQV